MDIEYDPEREAQAAMTQAAATHGIERQRWIQVAQAWLELARPQQDARSPEPSHAGSESRAEPPAILSRSPTRC
ncbi:hypothetical protein ASG57_33735 [Bradyrhizobium sp. Leaf396]|nr:hypothetical protein ASG57_33735 [Bradyrhizobium sp. Leaf396]